MLDTLIAGGVVIDGTDAPRHTADVGVRDGRVVSVGRVTERAKRTVDADGLVVAPGFIDIHTHYDAQVLWDPCLMPSPQHGVTTVLGGNCGISLAPSHDQDVAWVRGLLGRVEEIPTDALEVVIVKGTASFQDYLDGLGGHLGVNVAFMVGHSAIRRAVMGPAASERQATAEQVAAMCDLVRDALGAGAAGFSTALIANHIDGEGRPAPPQLASYDEIRQLAQACHGFPGAIMQMTPDYVPASPPARQLMYDMARLSGRPFTFTVAGRPEHDELIEKARADEANMRAQAALYDGIGDRLEFVDSLIMRHWPTPWPEIVAAPRPDRVRALSDPVTRRTLLEAALNAPPRAMTGQMFANRWLELEVNDVTDSSLTHLVGRRIVDLAAERGVDPFDAWLDVAVADQCRAGFVSYQPDLSRVPANRATLADPRSLWGLFDSGAHLTSMVGGANPTRMIEMLVRDEKLLSLEHAVHRLTGDLAGWWGLVDRGRVAEGCWADLVIFDPDRIGRGRLRRLEDWPGGAAHLTSDAIGVRHTFVNGTEVVGDGGYTGARPGQTLRSGADIL